MRSIYSRHWLLHALAIFIFSGVVLFSMPTGAQALGPEDNCLIPTALLTPGFEDTHDWYWYHRKNTGLGILDNLCGFAYWNKGTATDHTLMYFKFSGTPTGNNLAVWGSATGFNSCFSQASGAAYNDFCQGVPSGDGGRAVVIESPDILTASGGTYMRSNLDIVASCSGGCPWTPYGSAGPALGSGDLILEGRPYATNFTTTSGEFAINVNVPFTLNVNDNDFDVYFISLFTDTASGGSVPIVSFFPLGDTLTREFIYSYGFPGEYTPIARIGNSSCSSWTGSGCVYTDVPLGNDGGTLDITFDNPNINNQYPNNYFSFDAYDFHVNDVINFRYGIDANLCDINEVSFYRGYPGQIVTQDIPFLVDQNSDSIHGAYGSGTVIYNRTPPAPDTYFYPFLYIDCVGDEFHTLSLGGALDVDFGVSVLVVEEGADLPFVLPDEWRNGGGSENWEPLSQTGAYFASDRYNYDRLQDVKLQWQFWVDFTVGSVVLYHDPELLPFTKTFSSGSYLDGGDGYDHFSIKYSESGKYNPMIQVRSTSFDADDPLTYRNIRLGGETVKNPIYVIYVGEDTAPTSSSPINFLTGRGIFGLSPSTFYIPLSSDVPFYIKPFIIIANNALSSVIWIAGALFSLIESAPIFSLLQNVFVPDEGIYTMPTSLFGRPVSLSQFGTTFTVDYPPASGNNAAYVFLAQAIVMLSFFWYAFHRLFPEHHDE